MSCPASLSGGLPSVELDVKREIDRCRQQPQESRRRIASRWGAQHQDAEDGRRKCFLCRAPLPFLILSVAITLMASNPLPLLCLCSTHASANGSIDGCYSLCLELLGLCCSTPRWITRHRRPTLGAPRKIPLFPGKSQSPSQVASKPCAKSRPPLQDWHPASRADRSGRRSEVSWSTAHVA